MDSVLKTQRLLLRRPCIEDADALHAIFGDPMAMRYWSTLPHESLEKTKDWINSTRKAIQEGTGDDFVIECNDAVIGKCGLWRKAELGFLIAPVAWGRGYAREAAQAVILRAFDILGYREISAEIDPRNTRSDALLRRLGFREVGRAERTFCIAGEWSDSLYFTLARSG